MKKLIALNLLLILILLLNCAFQIGSNEYMKNDSERSFEKKLKSDANSELN